MEATKTMTKNLGGDRLGSGAKNDISLHNYNRSTHDLSYAWRSSMTPGTLVPFMKILALNGDTFTIDLKEIVKTIPTIGPVYASYKLQMDIFQCPIRLYNGLLHNNMTKIGLNMEKVKLPKFTLTTSTKNPKIFTYDRNNEQISNSALLKYLGLSGLGDVDWSDAAVRSKLNTTIERKFNAVPLLAYWDIYKNYYANKQEEKGVYIGQEITTVPTSLKKINTGRKTYEFFERENMITTDNGTADGNVFQAIKAGGNSPNNIMGTMMLNKDEEVIIFTDGIFTPRNASVIFQDPNTQDTTAIDLTSVFPNYVIQADNNIVLGKCLATYDYSNFANYVIGITYTTANNNYSQKPKLQKFDLQNIDEARIRVLQDTGLGNELSVNSFGFEPYSEILDIDPENVTLNSYALHGLAIKTYQSDLYENWLQTEWIDGVNGINAITAIDTSSGSFQIDALNLANKVYNMLNRIAVSGGSYEDWQEAVYSTEANRRAETPIYKGGMSAEIVFQEVVSTAASGNDPLGTLAGRGMEAGSKGGHVEIWVDEPSYIIGIVSITPRVDYSQGNDWDITELDTMNDLHKPALDGIGFEDLLEERMSYIGTYWDPTNSVWKKLACGKVPAWINYMTAVNKTYGDFADKDKCMFMTLNRQYEFPDCDINSTYQVGIKDMTTYIDPAKYNYGFAETDLQAQNFWIQIGCKVEARRVMSAKIIPSL